jgi:hypothetical protein
MHDVTLARVFAAGEHRFHDVLVIPESHEMIHEGK